MRKRILLATVLVPFATAIANASTPPDPSRVPTPIPVPGAQNESPSPSPSPSPVSPLPAPLPTVTPSNPLPAPLAYRIQTRYRTPAGQIIEKTHPAVLLVPMPIDVDGSVSQGQLPDLLAQLTIDAGRATLRTTLLPGAPAPMPLQLEAIVADPRGTTNLEIAYGFDALASTAPAVFTSTVQLLGASRVTSVGLDIETAGAGSTLSVQGSVYEPGPNGQRRDPQVGRITYSPVPHLAHFGILQGSDVATGVQQSGVDLSTDTPTKVDVVIDNQQGGSSSRGDLSIDKVPNLLSLILTDNDNGTRTYSYTASARVESLDLTMTDRRDQAIVDQFALTLKDMALRATLVQDTPTHATFESDTPIGVIAAGSGRGRAVAWLEEPAYLYSTNRGGGSSFAFQIRGLSRAEYDTGDPFLIDVNIAPGPFRVLIEDGSETLNARINDLPGHVRIQFSEAAGTMTYNGSADIASLTVDVTDPQGVSGRATRMSLALDDVPQNLSFAFGTAAGRVEVNAGSDAIGAVRLLLTSGPDLVVDPGFDGIVLQDVPSHYAVAVRLTGLKLARVTTGEPPTTISVSKTPGPFLVSLLEGTRSLRIEVHDLPATLTATFDGSGHLEYTASAPINRITAIGHDPQGLAGRATDLNLRITGVPAALTLDFGSGSNAAIDAHGARIGLIDLTLHKGTATPVDEGFDGVVLVDVPERYSFVARITGLRLASVSTSPPYTLDLRKDAGPFLVRLRQGARFTELKVLSLPDSLQATLNPAGAFSYTASAAIDKVLAIIQDPAGVSGRATSFTLEARGLPTSLTLDLPSSGGTTLDAHGAQIGLIDLLLTSGPPLAVEDGFDGIALRDTPSVYAIAVRLQGLRSASVTTAPPYSLSVSKTSGPFLVDMVQAARVTRVEIHDLPATIAVTLDPAGSASYTASAPIERLTAAIDDPAGVAGRATSFRLTLEELPAALDVSFGTAGAIAIDANGSAIGTLDVLLTSGPQIPVPDGFDGVLLRDVESHYVFAARLTGLRLVSVSSAAPYSLDLQKAPGPFLVDLQQGVRFTRLEVLNLPSSLQATVDPAQGRFSYDASATIGRLLATVSDPAGVTGRATLLSLSLTGLPQSLDLTFSSGATASIDAGGSEIGLIELALTSGPEPVPPATDGIILRDTPQEYVLAIKLTGLRNASVTSATPYSITMSKAPGPFIISLVQGTRTTLVDIRDLPATLSATLDPAGSLVYQASSGIDLIRADITDPAGVAGRANALRLLLQDLPQALNLTFDSANGASLDANGGSIGLIDLVATSGEVTGVPAGFDGIVLRDLADRYSLAVRMTGLRSASVSMTAPYTLGINKTAMPFIADLAQNARTTVITATTLPSIFNATLDPPAGTFGYSASAGIASLNATVRDPGGVMGRATLVRVQATQMPSALSLDFGNQGSVGLDAHGQTIGQIDFLATSGPEIAVDDGYDGVVLHDLADRYVIAARLTGLKVARVTSGAAPYTLSLEKTPGPFLIRMLQGARTTLVTVHDLPARLDASLNPAGSLTYSASSAVSQLFASIEDPAGISGRATRATAFLQGIPTSLGLSWAGANGAVTADAGGATLGMLQVMLTSGDDVGLPSDRDGLILEDLSDRYALFARITGLRRVSFAQGPPPSFDLRTTGGRLFQVSLSSEKPTGVALTSALIDALPAETSIAFTSPTSLQYRASSSVERLTLDASDPAGISGRATQLHAALHDLSTALDASWSTTGTITFDARGGTIGLVEVQLTSGPNDRLDPSVDGILLNDLADRYVIFVRITGLKKVVGTQVPAPDVTINTTGGRILHVRLNQFAAVKTTYTNITLDRLVPSVRIRMDDTGGQQVFYNASAPTNSLSFDSNSGDRWRLTASLENPLPANVSFCSSGNGFCNGFARSSGAGAFRFDASEHTTVNVFDCKRPLNSGCMSSPDDFTRLDNWRVRHVDFDADASDTGFDGYTWMNTNGHALQGYLLNRSGSGGFEANFAPGFWAVNRHVDWTWWGADKDRSGSINCPGGTSLSIRVFGIWIGVTSYMC